MQWDPFLGKLDFFRVARRGLGGPQLLDPVPVVGAAGSGQRRQDRPQIPVQTGRHGTRMTALRFGAVGDDELGLRPENSAESQTEIHGHTDDQGNIGLPQRFRSCPGKSLRVVSRHNATGHPVH